MAKVGYIFKAANVIEKSLNNTLNICCRLSKSYKEELSNFPFVIDLLDDALRSERLKETAHCRILYRILHDKNMQKRFVEYFLPNMDCSHENIQIPYPDKKRIDLTIKGNTFFLIIENKVNNAPEQKKQIDRYVKIAMQTYPIEKIYVLYLGGETTLFPSKYSISSETRNLLGNRIICKNYKDDITPWISLSYKQTEFNEQPFLKSTLLSYKTYLENKYNLNEMNNELDKWLVEALGLDSLPIAEKIKSIEDQINNIEKIRERLDSLLGNYREQNKIQDIKEWYGRCSDILSSKLVLTMEDSKEFGFNFQYCKREFRCCVSYDDYDNPFWGICGIGEDVNSCPRVFNSLKKFVLQSNNGFHNYDHNPPEWVVSDYAMKELIVDRFVALTHLICNSEKCSITK